MRPFSLLFMLFFMATLSPAQPFVTVQGTDFVRDGKPYHYLGTNFWYGINLAAQGAGGDRPRLLRELDSLQALGIANLRIMGGSEGPDDAPWRMLPTLQPAPGQYNEALWDGLDFLLAEMAKRDMLAIVVLNNFWPWSGGMAQYVAWAEESDIPYPPPQEGGEWFRYMNYSARFYKNKEARQAFLDFLALLIKRTNTYTGIPYREDPTIMAWQLANEPRGMLRPYAYRRWVRQTAHFIKKQDPNHLISIGSEGDTPAPTGSNFRRDHRYKHIDYTTVHIWIQNWQWYDPLRPEATFDKALQKAEDYLYKHLGKAEQLKKPLVLEEFGIARDGNSHADSASVEWRDRYFEKMFQTIYQLAQEGRAVAGCNFWAWGGEGRPRAPKTIWRAGDDFIGDPPHEHQGWYSVYDKDHTTLRAIREYSRKMSTVE